MSTAPENTPVSAPRHVPIAIVGGGLGGLTLARALHVNGVPSAVFDLETDRHARTQGGMLDMHEESGQAALRAMELYDGFRALVHPGGQATRVLDKHAAVHLQISDEDSGGGRPEIDRGALRDLILDALPQGTVHWNAKATAVRTLDDGRHEVTLANGGTFTADVLVGADGAWSRVRTLVSDVRPSYAGVSTVEIDLSDADIRHPESAKVVGPGMLFALGDGRGFLAHREADGSLHVYASVRTGRSWLDGIDFTDTAAAKRAVLEQFPDWHSGLRNLVADADGALVPRPIVALPAGHRWRHVPGVTLLGDAAHVMSPYAGEGANNAMLDAAELAKALIARPGDPEAALIAYEEEMFPRAEAAAAISAAGLETCFAKDAPRALVAQFTADPWEAG
ncbi:FAD-dependent oxidoreductase [Streptomyces flavofungini]|uniref:FAD-dependent oxidoreductase n=1 Tax=Streptomyces flavofungini TaxID=68200 RepID=UPI0034DF7F6D